MEVASQEGCSRWREAQKTAILIMFKGLMMSLSVNPDTDPDCLGFLYHHGGFSIGS